MNWFWLKWSARRNAGPVNVYNVTVTEPEAVLAPPVSDAEVRAAEDERRMQIERDCIEFGRRHYAALPAGSGSPAPGPCPKCTKTGVRVELIERVDAHSSECDWYTMGQKSKINEFGFPNRFHQHFAVKREVLRVVCSTCKFERGVVLPADAEVNQ